MDLGVEFKDIPYKGRGLASFKSYIGDFNFDPFLNSDIKLLEVGCGFGQLLIDISLKLSGNFELHGLNNYCDVLTHEKAYYIASLRGQQIPNHFEDDRLKFINHDVEEGLPYHNSTFNLIVSQVCFPYIKDKLFLLEEINRVLTNDGVAILHVGFEQTHLCDKTLFDWSTLDIRKEGLSISIKSFFEKFDNISYDKGLGGSFIIMSKSAQMSFNALLSETWDLKSQNDGFYGVKSSYVIDKYDRALDRKV